MDGIIAKSDLYQITSKDSYHFKETNVDHKNVDQQDMIDHEQKIMIDDKDFIILESLGSYLDLSCFRDVINSS